MRNVQKLYRQREVIGDRKKCIIGYYCPSRKWRFIVGLWLANIYALFRVS